MSVMECSRFSERLLNHILGIDDSSFWRSLEAELLLGAAISVPAYASGCSGRSGGSCTGVLILESIDQSGPEEAVSDCVQDI
jgi:hypothetical protein